MPDNHLENGDSPELEALFDRVAHDTHVQEAPAAPIAAVVPAPSADGDSAELQALFDSVAAAPVAPPVVPTPAPDLSAAGDSPELEALFDSVAASVAPVAPPPPVVAQVTAAGDSPELEALFDSVASQAAVSADAPAAAAPVASADNMYSRVGQLTRKLHDALHELGYDKSLERAASAIPDAKDRLSYIATLTENAAERVLNATDRAQPHQTRLESGAAALASAWDKVFANQSSLEAFKALAKSTRGYLAEVPEHTHATSSELMEIVMAQDFQDLTGQVIKKVVEMVQHMEQELLSFLMEYQPEIKPDPTELHSLENGPVVNPANRTDVVTDQKQVDDLLASLGF